LLSLNQALKALKLVPFYDVPPNCVGGEKKKVAFQDLPSVLTLFVGHWLDNVNHDGLRFDQQQKGGNQMRKEQCCIILVLSFAVTVLATPSCLAADQFKEDKIARAMQAAPPSISKNATIVDVDGTVLRQGSNGWTCLPSVGPDSTHPICNDAVWMSAMDAMGKHEPIKTDRIGISYMLAGDDNVNNADPMDKKQDPGEVWVEEGPHLMIIVPDPAMLAGLSDDPDNGGPYVMWKGTPYAHIMVPVGPRQSKMK
jgi:hypothetical protein